MASFRRADYEFAFRVARETYFNMTGDEERNAVLLMYMIEDCIGQMDEFPVTARETYPRNTFPELIHD